MTPTPPPPTPIPGTLLDTITGADTTTFTGSPPRTYMGDGWTNNAIPAGSNSVKITALTLYMVSTTTQAYTDVVARIQFWNNYNQAATPVFTNPAGPLITVDLGPLNLTANSFTAIPVTSGDAADLAWRTWNAMGFCPELPGQHGSWAGGYDQPDLADHGAFQWAVFDRADHDGNGAAVWVLPQREHAD